MFVLPTRFMAHNKYSSRIQLVSGELGFALLCDCSLRAAGSDPSERTGVCVTVRHQSQKESSK